MLNGIVESPEGAKFSYTFDASAQVKMHFTVHQCGADAIGNVWLQQDGRLNRAIFERVIAQEDAAQRHLVSEANLLVLENLPLVLSLGEDIALQMLRGLDEFVREH